MQTGSIAAMTHLDHYVVMLTQSSTIGSEALVFSIYAIDVLIGIFKQVVLILVPLPTFLFLLLKRSVNKQKIAMTLNDRMKLM